MTLFDVMTRVVYKVCELALPVALTLGSDTVKSSREADMGIFGKNRIRSRRERNRLRNVWGDSRSGLKLMNPGSVLFIASRI